MNNVSQAGEETRHQVTIAKISIPLTSLLSFFWYYSFFMNITLLILLLVPLLTWTLENSLAGSLGKPPIIHKKGNMESFLIHLVAQIHHYV